MLLLTNFTFGQADDRLYMEQKRNCEGGSSRSSKRRRSCITLAWRATHNFISPKLFSIFFAGVKLSVDWMEQSGVVKYIFLEELFQDGNDRVLIVVSK